MRTHAEYNKIATYASTMKTYVMLNQVKHRFEFACSAARCFAMLNMTMSADASLRRLCR